MRAWKKGAVIVGVLGLAYISGNWIVEGNGILSTIILIFLISTIIDRIHSVKNQIAMGILIIVIAFGTGFRRLSSTSTWDSYASGMAFYAIMGYLAFIIILYAVMITGTEIYRKNRYGRKSR